MMKNPSNLFKTAGGRFLFDLRGKVTENVREKKYSCKDHWTPSLGELYINSARRPPEHPLWVMMVVFSPLSTPWNYLDDVCGQMTDRCLHFSPQFLISLVKLKISHTIFGKTLILRFQQTPLEWPAAERDLLQNQHRKKWGVWKLHPGSSLLLSTNANRKCCWIMQ